MARYGAVRAPWGIEEPRTLAGENRHTPSEYQTIQRETGYNEQPRDR